MSDRPAPELEHAEGRFAVRDGMELYYQSWRPRATSPRATVALVHGFGAHSGMDWPLAVEMVRAGFAVSAFDQRGMGRSPGRRGYFREWDDYLEDLGVFLRLTGGSEPEHPLFLVGESVGGLVVLEYAERHPDGLRGVIVLAPLLAQPGISPFLRGLAQVMARVMPRSPIEIPWDFTLHSRDPVAVQRFRDDPLIRARGRARLSVHLPSAIARTQQGAAGFSLPILMLHGDADAVAPPEGSREFFAALGPGEKELLEYEGAYHALIHDLCAEQVERDIIRWIEQHL